MDSEGMFMRAFREIARNEPIDKISVSRVAGNAGLSRQAFYSHFMDKYDLSVRIFEKEFAPIAQGHRAGHTTWLQSGIQHLGIYAQDPDYYRNVLSSRDPAGLRAHLFKRLFVEFQYKCEKRGASFEGEGMRNALEMVVSATTECTIAWVDGGCKEPPEKIVRSFDATRPLILSPYLEDSDSVTF